MAERPAKKRAKNKRAAKPAPPPPTPPAAPAKPATNNGRPDERDINATSPFEGRRLI